ncbi:uncharacterized protein NEMAJ01_2385, partial [Nematocida major]|uniref:uncharacterized protein n=1 Tax=Nematocida major TaxID=1912982 RepID=UPI0020079EB1
MDGLMNRLCCGIFSLSACIKDIEELIERTTPENYHHCIVFLLVLKEKVVELPPAEEADSQFRAAVERLKAHTRRISAEEWAGTVESAGYIVHREEAKEEDKSALLVNLVIETLIRASTADIERAIEMYLEEKMTDPRTQLQKSTSVEIVEEILCNLAKLPEQEIKTALPAVVKLLTQEHVPTLLKYVGEIPKLLLLALYVHNRSVYSEVQKEFLKNDSPSSLLALEDFPEVDVEEILRRLYKNSAMFRPLDRIIKTRPVYRERIVEEVVKYIPNGSRTKTVQFVKDNVECFMEKIQEMGLGCEEVLMLAERRKELLEFAFEMMQELKMELRDRKKKPLNAQKKEKRLANLVSALSSELAAGTDGEIGHFIRAAHGIDSELLSKVCIGLFRVKPPAEELKETLSCLVKMGPEKTSASFVFTVLPYLSGAQKFELIEEYLKDDVSMTLFLRLLKPEDVLRHAHTLRKSAGRRVLDLAFGRTEVFTDRIVSVTIEEICRMEKLPALFMRTLKKALRAFVNIKPFLVEVLRREWRRLFQGSRADLIRLLEKLGAVSAEILLEVPEEELQEVISASETLREKVLEYVAQQPK